MSKHIYLKIYPQYITLSRSSCQFLGLFHFHSHKLLAVLFGVDSLFYYPPISVLCFPILVVVVSFYLFYITWPLFFLFGSFEFGVVWCRGIRSGVGWGGLRLGSGLWSLLLVLYYRKSHGSWLSRIVWLIHLAASFSQPYTVKEDAEVIIMALHLVFPALYSLAPLSHDLFVFFFSLPTSSHPVLSRVCMFHLEEATSFSQPYIGEWAGSL